MCFFRKKVVEKQVEIKNPELLDDVWVFDNGTIYLGWIFEVTRRHLTILYNEGLKDFRFRIQRPFKADKIEQDGKILYFYNPSKDNV